MPVKKLKSIQVLRGVAAVSVVLYHMLIIEKKYSGGDIYLPGIFKAGQAGVDLFFVISGFIMVTITSEKWSTGIKTGEFLLHRFARIYPNYWFYFILTFAVYLLYPGLINSSQGHRVNLVRSFFLIPSETLPLILVAWSLIYELYFYLVFSVLLRCRQKWLMTALFTWLIVLLLINGFFHLPPNPFSGVITSPYAIEFIFGALSAFMVRNKKLMELSLPVLLFITAIVIIAIPCLFPYYYSINLAGLFKQCIVFGLLFSMLLMSCVLIERKQRIKFPGFLVRIGDISYTIYLSHIIIMTAIGRAWATYFQMPLSRWDNILIFPLILAIIIIYSFLAYRWIEYPSYKFFTRLFSRRVGRVGRKFSSESTVQ